MTLGCNRVQTVAKEDLFELARKSYSAKSTVMYYKGSSDRYDYFCVGPADQQKTYRVALGGVSLSQRFPLTEESGRWVIVPIR